MKCIIQRIAKTTKRLSFSNFLSKFHGVKGKINSLEGALMFLMMFVVCVVKELPHVFLVKLHIESIASETDESDPCPDESQHTLVESAFLWGELTLKVTAHRASSCSIKFKKLVN